MAITIRKKATKSFFHYPTETGASDFALSNMLAKIDDNDLVIVEPNGNQRGQWAYGDVTIYDDSVSGGAETFTNTVDLFERLVQLGYPAFYEDGEETSGLGTRVTVDVSGTYDINWDAGDTFELTMTGNTTFSDDNLPTGTETKTIEIIMDGNYTATLPSYWEALPSNDSYSGSVRNHFVVSCVNGTASSEDVIYQLENMSS